MKINREQLLNNLLVGKEFDKLREWLKEVEFVKQPATRQYHGAYEGGLFDHSYAVAMTLCELTQKNKLKWEKERSPILVGIAHDLCKFDSYRSADDGNGFVWNEEQIDYRHGEKSADILKVLVPDLTQEEELCIRFHMGFTIPHEQWENYRQAIRLYPNVLWTHHADMLAAFIEGV